ncbi:MAG: HpsJ family protein [Cyanobacteria bacterium P01_H01_bin.121]
MTSSSSPARVPAIALALKSIGLAMVAISIFDFLLLAWPPVGPDINWLEWRVSVLSQVIDRGVIPLLGLAIISLGVWISSQCGQKGLFTGGLLLVALGLSAILGLTCLGLAGYHVREVRLASAAATREINEQAQTAEAQLDTRLNQEVEALGALLESGQVPPQLDNPQLEDLLAAYEQNPQVLEQRQELARNQALSQIRQEQLVARQETQQQFRQSMFRIPVSGVLLATGYLILAWFGFKGLFLGA